MKNLILGLMFTFVAINLAQAELSDVEVTATRQKLAEEKTHSNNITTVTKEIVYDVTVQSKSFKPLTNVVVKYIIFVDDAKAGSKDAAIENSHTGSETVGTLEANRAYSFKTNSFKLSTEELDAGWYYSSGSGSRAKDKTGGVWFRVYSEGKMIGEYANPSIITKKETWKD